MKKFGLALLSAALLCAPGSNLNAQSPETIEGLLSTDRIGAKSFLKSNPTWDGTGVVIAVMDTGVDMGAPGLKTNPSGSPKVIVTRDFSGQGTIALTEVSPEEETGGPALRDDTGALRGFEKHAPDVDSLKMGWVDENRFKNAGVSDLNGNGTSIDKFGVLLFQKKDGKNHVVIDLDGDGDLSDESVMGSYEDTLTSFTFRGFDPEKEQSPLNYSLYVNPSGHELELHFDDGGHGTHVAGIAAGYKVHGKETLHGIAPGAEVMSLKIGNNALAGGATTTGSKKRAIEFAGEWSKKMNRPVVLNLSYGIGSEIEGHSEIDQLVTDMLRKYPDTLFMSTSAGNSGPSISNVGQPAGATLAFSAAAALTKENAKILFNSKMSVDRVFSFSSRGGELVKPDGLLPGVASSSVPPFLGYHVMAGTSMAAPQGAGVQALLLSAARSENLTVNNGMVRRAMKYSGIPLRAYGPLDQGGGMVEVGGAWDVLRKLSKSKEAQSILGYETDTPCPTCPHGSSPASYWRVGQYVPGEKDVISFDITPLFPEGSSASKKAAYFETYKLKSNASWLDVETPTLYMKGEQHLSAKVVVDPSGIPDRSGTFIGTVSAVPESGPSGRAGTAFELQVVIIRPEIFDWNENRRRSWKKEDISIGEVHRYFVLPPVSSSLMAITLEQIGADPGQVRLMVSDPNGRRVRVPQAATDPVNHPSIRFDLGQPDLKPGVWEVNIYSSFRNRRTLEYNLDVEFFGIKATDLSIITTSQGETPSVEGEFTNVTNTPFRGTGSGVVDGYGREDFYDVSGDTLTIPFEVDAGMASAAFTVAVSPEVYGLFTDVAVTIENAAGKAVVKGGLGQSSAKVTLSSPPPGSYVLKIQGALTHESPGEWTVEVDEYYRYKGHQRLRVTGDNGDNLILYPQHPVTLTATLSGRPAMAPDGYEYRGELRLIENGSKGSWFSVPLKLVP